MKTLLMDSNAVLPAVRRKGHRQWFLNTADGQGFAVHNAVSGEAVKAYVNHGRWIADCPDCRGAENATLDDPVFMCLGCGNESIGGALRPVEFPDDDTRREIELILNDRKTAHQNWFFDEPVEKLELENSKHGGAS